MQEMSNVRLVDLSAIQPLEYKSDFAVTGWAVKAFAIIHSSFSELLCLDSDSMPVVDPSALFQSAQFLQHGNIFWSDANINGLDPFVYEMFELSPPWQDNEAFLAAESGQIIFNRYDPTVGCMAMQLNVSLSAVCIQSRMQHFRQLSAHREMHAEVLHWLWFVTANSDFFYPRMHGDKDTYRLAFALANKASQYNQIRIGPQLGLTPWKRPEGLYYVSAGFVQPDFANATAFYHRVEHGAKFNPGSPLVLNPMFVTTPLSHSWRRPAGVQFFELEYGAGGMATHYPAAGVNVTVAQGCCSSPSMPNTPHSPPALAPFSAKNSHASAQSATYFSSCSCPSTSSSDDHSMLAIPLDYFPDLHSIISISQQIFAAYQHGLWRQEQATQF